MKPTHRTPRKKAESMTEWLERKDKERDKKRSKKREEKGRKV